MLHKRADLDALPDIEYADLFVVAAADEELALTRYCLNRSKVRGVLRECRCSKTAGIYACLKLVWKLCMLRNLCMLKSR